MKLFSKHPMLKLLLWPLISILLIPLSLWIASEGNAMLRESGLQFRPWVRFTLFMIFVLSIVSFLLSIIFLMIRALRRSFIRTVWKKRVAWISGIFASVVLGLAVLGIGFYALSLVSFIYEPEKVVTKNNTQAVERVVSITDDIILYYEYHGPFLMGTELLGQ